MRTRTSRWALMTVFVLALAVAASAQTPSPAGLPQRVILNVTEAPATSVAVTWRMDAAFDDAAVQVAVATDGAAFVEKATSVPATLERGATEKGREVFHYSAVLSGLSPATRYAYRVGRTDTWSEWMQFTTANAEHEAFSFVWFGDPQDDLISMCSRVFREAFRAAPDAGFWLFSGDLVTDAEDKLWGQLFTAGSPMFGMVPTAMTPGNHDMAFLMKDGDVVRNAKGKKERTKTVSALWRPHYTLPQNGPQHHLETTFTFDYQGVRFVLIDSNDHLAEQALWLDRVLASNPQRWTVVAFHHPCYSSGRDRDDTDTRDAFQAILEKHGVDLVLAGHDHTYARSQPLRAGAIASSGTRGTVYVNSSSGPKFYVYAPKYQHLMARTAENVQLFQVIRIDGARLSFVAYTAAGRPFDRFELTK